MKSLFILLSCTALIFSCNRPSVNKKIDKATGDNQALAEQSLNQEEELGKLLFFEPSLSEPPGQSCSTCHDPSVAFADIETGIPVSRGAVAGLYGNRNDMPVSYSMFVPPLHYEAEESVWVGGFFWDGRSNTLEEQAMGPPLNPLEMANSDTNAIHQKLMDLEYSGKFDEVYGPGALSDPGIAFTHMAEAIAAYERSNEVNPFTSKYDYYLRGEAELTEQEMRGLELYIAEDKGNCSACHPHSAEEEGAPVLFTDFTYDNLGAPKNPENPFYLLPAEYNPDGAGFIDLGLGMVVGDASQNGKFRVPTLRNVAITPPYMHNGVFKTLFEVVAFYNTRDILDWPPPEVSENVNMDELGNLGLTNQEMEDIVAFLKTLTDHWK